MNSDNVSPLRPGAVFNATRPLPGLEPHPAGITLSQYGPRWIAERLAPSGQPLRPRTKELYEGQLRLHLLPAFGTLDLAEITTPDIRRWCEQMRSPRGPGAVTAAKCYRLLHSIMGTAAEDGFIVANPCRVRGAGKEPKSNRDIPSVLELFELAEAIDDRLRCLVLCAGYLGLRKGEMLALHRRDIDLDTLEVTVKLSRSQLKSGQMIVGPVKTDHSERIVTIPRSLVPELQAHLDKYAQPGPGGWVFTGAKGGPLGPSWFTKQWGLARDHVGVPNLHLHDLRHLAATLAAMTGATTKEVMDRLGHTSIETALRYQHAVAARDRALADALDEVIITSLPEYRRRYIRISGEVPVAPGPGTSTNVSAHPSQVPTTE